MLRRLGLVALVLVPVWSAFAQDGVLTASVDRTTIRENESFRYVLRAEGQLSGRPDLSALAVDFDVVDSYQSSNISIVNGRTSQITEWVVELIPRGPGSYDLPSIEVGGVSSNAVTVEILPAQNVAGAAEDVFIEVELDRQSSFVQAQAIFTLKLYVGIGTGRQTLTAPLIGGGEAIVEKLGSDYEFQTVRDGRVYSVRERKYAIFPQEVGMLSIGPAVYEAMIMPNRGFARQQRLRSDVLELEVLPAVPPPPELSGAVWLPATRLEIAETWSDGGIVFEQGVPQTRTLEVVADGLLETQLPELRFGATEGLRQYSDQPELNRVVTADGIEAHRTERFAVIAQEPGSITLPTVELPWFDIETGSWEIARLEGRSVEVTPGPDVTVADEPSDGSGTAAPSGATDAGWWPALSGVLALGWLLTAAAWAYSSRRGRQRTSASPAPRLQTARSLLRQLNAACRVHDPERARDLLLAWAGRQFDSDPPHSLGALASRLSGPLADEVKALEAALYGPVPSEWRGQALAELLKQTQSVGHQSASADKDPLVPLYR
jgi:hypothetical protein